MTKHTPGPWSMVRHASGSDHGDGAHTLWPHGAIIGEVSAPDAALIAAAPDLLTALDWIARCPSMPGPAGTTAYIISDAHMRAARAAIAKATGEQS